MKIRTTLAAALAVLSIALLALAEPVTNAVVDVYAVVETNWVPSFATSTLLWPPEANTTTYHESGTVASNTYLRTTWRNHTHAVQIESRPFAFLTRSCKRKVEP
jgi:hypothetical protein